MKERLAVCHLLEPDGGGAIVEAIPHLLACQRLSAVYTLEDVKFSSDRCLGIQNVQGQLGVFDSFLELEVKVLEFLTRKGVGPFIIGP